MTAEIPLRIQVDKTDMKDFVDYAEWTEAMLGRFTTPDYLEGFLGTGNEEDFSIYEPSEELQNVKANGMETVILFYRVGMVLEAGEDVVIEPGKKAEHIVALGLHKVRVTSLDRRQLVTALLPSFSSRGNLPDAELSRRANNVEKKSLIEGALEAGTPVIFSYPSNRLNN